MPRDDEPIPAHLNLECIVCGYSLTGLLERRCPECGESFDPRETWLENERSTWEYHFENVRSRSDYFRLGYVAAAILLFLLLSYLNMLTLAALPLIVTGEMYTLWSGGPGLRVRMCYWTVCVAWGALVVSIF